MSHTTWIIPWYPHSHAIKIRWNIFMFNVLQHWLISRNHVYDWVRTLPQEVKPKVFYQVPNWCWKPLQHGKDLPIEFHNIPNLKAESRRYHIRCSNEPLQLNIKLIFQATFKKNQNKCTQNGIVWFRPEFLDVQTYGMTWMAWINP